MTCPCSGGPADGGGTRAGEARTDRRARLDGRPASPINRGESRGAPAANVRNPQLPSSSSLTRIQGKPTDPCRSCGRSFDETVGSPPTERTPPDEDAVPATATLPCGGDCLRLAHPQPRRPRTGPGRAIERETRRRRGPPSEGRGRQENRR